MRILVTGGAGYIGSITARELLDSGHKVVVVDNLERGNKWAVDKRAVFLMGDLLNKKIVKKIFLKKFDGVIHFAGYISMKESVEKPGTYFENNVVSTINLLEGMIESGSDNFVFSSSAGVYGNAKKIPIPENSELFPINPYGETKLIIENILKWHKIKSVALRYFNAAGALPDISLGEAHYPETHIIPLAIDCALKGKKFTLFGTDYPTPDGTCVRDYIHVSDLANAHILTLEALKQNKKLLPAYNIGTGRGYSNKQILNMVEKISGRKIKIENQRKRMGDATLLVANTIQIKKHLGFKPKYSNLKNIIETAYNWYLKKSN
ncbi:MAG: UDP-glucose 4-epimerase GalE [Patescibacteria group bacterium]|nr:UDP-glucose 4-epimerase GalE [Patescibacteria group bacterium]